MAFRLLRTLGLAGLGLMLGLGSALPAAPARTASRRKAARPAAAEILGAGALVPFFKALDAGQAPGSGRVVRILQFGDSHTAADFWTGELRRRFQAQWGDAGPGLLLPGLPWRGYAHEGTRWISGHRWPAECVRRNSCDGVVGLAGAYLAAVPGETFRMTAPFADFQIHAVVDGEVLPLAWIAPEGEEGPGDPVTLEKRSFTPLPDGRTLVIAGPAQPFHPSTRTLSFQLPDGARLLGIDLRSGAPGVLYDELGLNGSELLNFGRWSPAVRDPLLAHVKPDLVVFAFGTNEAGRPLDELADLRARLVPLLKAFRESAGAPVLLVGPLDRSSKGKAKRFQLNLQVKAVQEAMKAAAREAGCAYWDPRRAMGGPGAIVKWQRTGLAKKDLVHLTPKGYERLGDQMADALLQARQTWQKATRPHPRPPKAKRPKAA